MGRSVVLSNNRLFVGLDESGLVHDFYYPYVGLDNLDNARNSQHRIGVWVNNAFSWVNDGSWEIVCDFEPRALVSNISMRSTSLGIRLELVDFVDCEFNAFIRIVKVINESNENKDVRLFMHQVFEISRSGRADTALYVPDDHYLLDYKGRCCLLIAGKFTDGTDYDQYAVGSCGLEGKDGTYKDAEDGELSNNPVEHGGVDSVLRFKKNLDPGRSYSVDYWVVAADSQYDAQVVHTHLKHYSVNERLIQTRHYWHKWLQPVESKINLVDSSYHDNLTKSLLVIKAHCDERGSILASGDSSIFNYGRDYYCYCWPRDGSYAVWPLIRLGLYDEARAFFSFARDTMHRDGYMMHKYQPDRAIGSTWHPLIHNKAKELAIQEDETASVIFMLGEYYRASQDKLFIINFYDSYIRPCAHFLANYVDSKTGLPHASYDLWEEKFLTTTYTTTCVIAALNTASYLADITDHPDDKADWQKAASKIRANLPKLYTDKGYFVKGFYLEKDGSLMYDETVDISSLYGPLMFAGLPLTDSLLVNTASAVSKQLANKVPIGGVVRYVNDNYFLSKNYIGNPWIVCSLWFAQYQIALNQKVEAKKYIDWSIKKQLYSGILSEQFDPETGEPLSVAPLVWSHAELVNTLLDYFSI